jgi:DNA-binding response OmpR family regulator
VKVLVIEDFQLLRDSLAQGLREAGFAVDATGDGEEGLWYATSSAYDVIVLDLNLPGLDGLSILRDLRKRRSDAHVLVLTARDGTDDRVKGLNLGADDYVVKPFVFAELLARVRALVRRKYGNKSPVIRVGDMEVDTAERVVRRGGKRIELTGREYAMLELLATRAGQVVTRADIWEHVYDFNAEADSNVINVFIGHLRRKIEGDGLPKLIRTRRGHGYVLAAAERAADGAAERAADGACEEDESETAT